MTPKEIIENEIATKLKNKPERAASVGAVVELAITGANGGTWTIDCTKPGGEVKSGSAGAAKLIVTMADTDFVDMCAGKLNPQMAFLGGKIKVKGDISLALKLGQLIG
jgi:putative sterol carrier protein